MPRDALQDVGDLVRQHVSQQQFRAEAFPRGNPVVHYDDAGDCPVVRIRIGKRVFVETGRVAHLEANHYDPAAAGRGLPRNAGPPVQLNARRRQYARGEVLGLNEGRQVGDEGAIDVDRHSGGGASCGGNLKRCHQRYSDRR